MLITDLPPRIADRTTIDPDCGCWRLNLALDKDGYARVAGEGAHRWAYKTLVGPIPPGLVLDHVEARGCRWRNCIWPAHLEPVTIRVNTLRGRSFAAINAAKDRCDRGHEFDLFNTYWYKNRRICRRCNASAVSEYKQRQALSARTVLAAAA